MVSYVEYRATSVQPSPVVTLKMVNRARLKFPKLSSSLGPNCSTDKTAKTHMTTMRMMKAEKTGRTERVSALMIILKDESSWKPLMTRKTRTKRSTWYFSPR